MANVYEEYFSALLIESDIAGMSLVEPNFFPDRYAEIFTKIREFAHQYSKLPDLQLFKTNSNMHGMPEKVSEPLQYYADRVINQAKEEAVAGHLAEIAEMLQGGDGDEAFQALRQASAAMSDEFVIRAGGLLKLSEATPLILEGYQKVQDGELSGIPTPWPCLTELNMGWQPGEFIIIIGRPHKGKTWLALKAAEDARAAGKKVLFISMEMNGARILRRSSAITSRVSHSELRKGTLSDSNFRRLVDGLERVKDEGQGDLYILDESHIDDDAHVADAVVAIQPDIVIVDSFYELQYSKGATAHHERVRGLAGALKRIARVHQIPVIGTTQFGRSVGDEDVQAFLSQAGFTDAIGQVPDTVIGMFMPPDLEDIDQAELVLLKYRDEGGGLRWRIAFSTRTMDFHELGRVGADGELVENTNEMYEDYA